MKVRVSDEQLQTADLPDLVLDQYSYAYECFRSEPRKLPRHLADGHVSHVYAIEWRWGAASFWVRESIYGHIIPAPAAIFEVLDPRTSGYWTFHHRDQRQEGRAYLWDHYPVTLLAVPQWTDGSNFWERFVDGAEPESSEMERLAKLIENEFDDPQDLIP